MTTLSPLSCSVAVIFPADFDMSKAKLGAANIGILSTVLWSILRVSYNQNVKLVEITIVTRSTGGRSKGKGEGGAEKQLSKVNVGGEWWVV